MPSCRHSGGVCPAVGRLPPQTFQGVPVTGHLPSGHAGDWRCNRENITTKEQVLELIQGIVKNERFKVDAYFFCGFPTDQPNEKLIQLCESYLEKQDTETKTTMLAEMERMVAAGSVLDAGKNVLGSTADVQRVLEAKNLL